MKTKAVAVFAIACTVLAAWGAENWKLPPETAKYKPARGVELAVANCSLCHSADYLSTQPPLGRAAWKATVEKMRTKYGAPINTNSVDAIVDYLTTAYGPKAP